MSWEIHIPSRTTAIVAQRGAGGRIAAVFPIHYPRALFRSFGALPVEVWGPPGAKESLGDAHLPSYTCSIVRKGLSFVLEGGLGGVDLIVVPHCCDSLQGLGSILQGFVPGTKPVIPLYVPRGSGEANLEFFAHELAALGKTLSRVLSKDLDEEQLASEIEDEENANRLTAELLARRLSLPVTNRKFYDLLRAREYLPARLFASLAEKGLLSAEEHPSDQVPLLLSGVVPEPKELLDLFSELGALIVADDSLSTGRRIYPPSKRDDPWSRMAESILLGPPDSTRGSSFEARAQHLLGLARASGARGAIFLSVKFCEPEQFYLPALRKRLEGAGIPSLVLEVTIGDPLSSQMVTRLEAFMETIG